MSNRVIYSQGRPYGAPLVMLRGGGLKRSGVLGWLREEGFRWNSRSYAWESYKDVSDFRRILNILREAYGCEIHAKEGLDPNYVIDLTDGN